MLEHVSRGIERDVEPRYARVGGGQVRVVRGPDRHRRHRLEAFLRRGQRGGAGPKVHLYHKSYDHNKCV